MDDDGTRTPDAAPPLLVHRIQRFCLHDGPGIRTTVFLQGCARHCWWCHNPAARAPADAATARWAPEALATHLARDARYWQGSGGGVTLSGGEPLEQAPAAAALLAALGRAGHHRAVDTAGFVPEEALAAVLPEVDLWLWDLKTANPERRADLGAEPAVALANLARVLRGSDAPVRLRIPLIPGFNTGRADLEGLAAAAGRASRRVHVELLVGHDAGREPESAAARGARPTPAQVREARAVFRARGIDLQEAAP